MSNIAFQAALAAQAPGAPAPLPRNAPVRSYYDGKLKLTDKQKQQFSNDLRQRGLDFSKGTVKGNNVDYGEGKNGYSVFMNKDNLVVTGRGANSPSGVDGAGYAINSSGKAVDRTDNPSGAKGMAGGGNPFPGANGIGGAGGPGVAGAVGRPPGGKGQ